VSVFLARFGGGGRTVVGVSSFRFGRLDSPRGCVDDYFTYTPPYSLCFLTPLSLHKESKSWYIIFFKTCKARFSLRGERIKSYKIQKVTKKRRQHKKEGKRYRGPQGRTPRRRAIGRKPARAQVLASSRIAGARATGIKASLLWTRRLRSLQIDQATNQKKASKP
jgi:hypothetical protein